MKLREVPVIELEIAEEMADATMVSFLPCFTANNAYDLLGQVIGAIEAEPLRYDQSTWMAKLHSHLTFRREQQEEIPNCGTMACIAGWIAVGLDGPIDNTEIPRFAARKLGFSYDVTAELSAAYSDGSLDARDAYHKFRLEEVMPVRQLFEDDVLSYRTDKERNENEVDYYKPGTVQYAELGVRKIRAFMAQHEARLKAKAV